MTITIVQSYIMASFHAQYGLRCGGIFKIVKLNLVFYFKGIQGVDGVQGPKGNLVGLI